MSLFEEWRLADDRWAEVNRDLLQIVYHWFLQQGSWPEVEPLQRYVHQSGVRSIDVRAAANAKPGVPGQLTPAIQPSITLGARYLLELPEAGLMLDLTVAATRQAVRAYLSAPPGTRPMVPRSEVLPQSSGDPLTLERFPAFVTMDHPTAFAGGSYEGDWSLAVHEALVMRFENVSDPTDYVTRQMQVIREWADEADRRSGRDHPTRPARAFVVMPFHEPWSDQVYAFIRRAVESLDGALEAVRADEISQLGRITDQIVDELRSCDLVIADITGRNLNVAWELGYAYAHGKLCAILMRHGESNVPFDIYDHRRLDHAPTPTQDDEDRLSALLRGALGR